MRERIGPVLAALADLATRARRRDPDALLAAALMLAAGGLVIAVCVAGVLQLTGGSTAHPGRRPAARDRCAAAPMPCGATIGAERLSAVAAASPTQARRTPRPRRTVKPARRARPRARRAPPAPAVRVAFAPYVDTSLSASFSLTTAAQQTGVKDFSLAFIESGGGCRPVWGGGTSLGSNPVAAQISSLRKIGGDVRVSFGGQSGTDLAQACGDAAQLAAAYQKVISAYRIRKLDFDVEGAALSDTSASRRRARAIARLQAQDPHLRVSFTLPALPSGLTQPDLALLAGAHGDGVHISAVNIMTMDYGDSAAPRPAGRMGAYAIDAARSAHAQIAQVLGLGGAQAWRRIAITPMIGVNDAPDEIFTVADASRVARFAADAHLAWLSMWSGARDRECRGGAASRAVPTCSSIVQARWAFSKALRP